MSWAEALSMAAGALRAKRRRTLLSLLGVTVGVACVVVLVGLGEGARRYVVQQFESLGTRLLTVVPGRTETAGALPGLGKPPNDLTLEDAARLRRLPGVRSVAPVVLGNETVSRGELSRRSLVLGTTPEMRALRGLQLRSGSFLPDGPWERGAPVAVLGRSLARELFGGRHPVGARIRVGDWRLRVVGVLEGRGVHMGVDLDEVLFLPAASALSLFDLSSLSRVVLEARPGADVEAVRRAAERLLLERHGERDVTVVTQDAVLSTVSRILGVLTLALAGIAAVSLLVAGVGIMNVMLVSVAERTREIGLCKALGAAPRQVLGLFLVEACLLSLLGSLAGVALGQLGTRLLSATWPALDASPPAWAVALAVGLALTVGLLSGVSPARRAMRLDPVAALSRR